MNGYAHLFLTSCLARLSDLSADPSLYRDGYHPVSYMPRRTFLHYPRIPDPFPKSLRDVTFWAQNDGIKRYVLAAQYVLLKCFSPEITRMGKHLRGDDEDDYCGLDDDDDD